MARLREEVHDQIKALQDLKLMASSYGFDISRPANDAREAVQWLYFAYLGTPRCLNAGLFFRGSFVGNSSSLSRSAFMIHSDITELVSPIHFGLIVYMCVQAR